MTDPATPDRPSVDDVDEPRLPESCEECDGQGFLDESDCDDPDCDCDEVCPSCGGFGR